MVCMYISFHLFQVHADPNTIGYRMSQHTDKQNIPDFRN
jgi:hypothetical protein